MPEKLNYSGSERGNEYDPESFRDKALDHGAGNDLILEGYRDSWVETKTTVLDVMREYNSPMWEHVSQPGEARNNIAHWDLDGQSRSHMEEAENPGPVRAMCFAKDLAEPFADVLLNHRMEFRNADPAGRESMAAIREAMLNGEKGEDATGWEKRFMPEPRPELVEYIERHTDWEERFGTLERFCQDLLETGRNMTFNGILGEDETGLADGRGIMRDAAALIERALRDDRVCEDLLKFAGSDRMDLPPTGQLRPGVTAAHRISYASRVREMLEPRHGEQAAGEAAGIMADQAVLRDTRQAGERTLGYIRDADSAHKLVNDELSRIADMVFVQNNEARGLSLMGSYIRAGIDENDGVRVAHGYNMMDELQRTMAAVSFGLGQNGESLAWDERESGWSAVADLRGIRERGMAPEELRELVQNIREEIPESLEEVSTINKLVREELRASARGRLGSAERAVDQAERNGWNEGIYGVLEENIQGAAELGAVLQTGRVQEATAAGYTHELWDGFLTRRYSPLWERENPMWTE